MNLEIFFGIATGALACFGLVCFTAWKFFTILVSSSLPEVSKVRRYLIGVLQDAETLSNDPRFGGL